MARDPDRLTRFENAIELPMLGLALLLALTIAAPHLFPISPETAATLNLADALIWAVFAVEFGVRVFLAPARLTYVLAHWYDVALIALPFLRPLRLLRLARIALALLRAGEHVRRVVRRRAVAYPLGAALMASAAIALAMPLIERGAANASIVTFGDGLWWGATTVTTVGYGDAVPVTPFGRGLALALMLVGITSFGIVTASVAAYLVEEREGTEQARLLETLEAIERRLAALEETLAAPRADEGPPLPVELDQLDREAERLVR